MQDQDRPSPIFSPSELGQLNSCCAKNSSAGFEILHLASQEYEIPRTQRTRTKQKHGRIRIQMILATNSNGRKCLSLPVYL